MAEPIPPHVGELSFTNSTSYYRSAGNYITGGTSSTDLPIGGYFSYLSDGLSINYDAFPQWRFNANLNYGYTTASNSVTTFTGQGLTEGGLGAQFWLRQKRWAIVPTLQAAFPFYRNSLTQTDAMIGNGSVFGELGAWGLLYYHPITGYGYLGYRYQDNGLAGLMMVDLGASYRFDTARLRLGIRGETEVTEDSDTSQPYFRNLILASVDNNSQKFYSVNPTVFEGYAEFDWLFTRMWEAGAGFAQSFYGNNAAYGWTVTAMVRFRLPTTEASRNTPRNQPEYYEPPAISEPIFAPVGTEEDTPAPRRKNVRKKSKNIDQMLKDTEKSLEN